MGPCRTRTLWNTERDRNRFWHVQRLHCKLSQCKRVDVDAKPCSQVNRKRLCVSLYTFTLTDPISVRDGNVDNRIRQPSVEQNRYFHWSFFLFSFLETFASVSTKAVSAWPKMYSDSCKANRRRPRPGRSGDWEIYHVRRKRVNADVVWKWHSFEYRFFLFFVTRLVSKDQLKKNWKKKLDLWVVRWV